MADKPPKVRQRKVEQAAQIIEHVILQQLEPLTNDERLAVLTQASKLLAPLTLLIGSPEGAS